MSTWRIPFICRYEDVSSEDGCSEVNGDIIIDANSMKEAIQKAEYRLSRLGFNRITIDSKFIDELYAL